jgi:apolipoprotein D and lipocalin family protein
VGEPARKYLWVLSREPTVEDATYRGILERIEAQGYDPDDLVLTSRDSR